MRFFLQVCLLAWISPQVLGGPACSRPQGVEGKDHWASCPPTSPDDLRTPREVYLITSIKHQEYYPGPSGFSFTGMPRVFFKAADDEPSMILTFSEGELKVMTFPSKENWEYTPGQNEHETHYLSGRVMLLWETRKRNSFLYNVAQNQGFFPYAWSKWFDYWTQEMVKSQGCCGTWSIDKRTPTQFFLEFLRLKVQRRPSVRALDVWPTEADRVVSRPGMTTAQDIGGLIQGDRRKVNNGLITPRLINYEQSNVIFHAPDSSGDPNVVPRTTSNLIDSRFSQALPAPGASA
ncbi:MAG: hypothetical protein M1833_006324 [Piccolia ochrophora]|nr:MAG: hypothetical protein M1833_006324 [Piccolia ochrophora]